MQLNNILKTYCIENGITYVADFLSIADSEGELNITVNVNVYNLKLGESIFLPAVLNCLKLNSVYAKILEVYYY